MGAFDLTHQGRYVDALGKLNDLKSSGVMPPPADLYCAGKPPVNWYGNAPRTVDEECYKKVEAYLDRKKSPQSRPGSGNTPPSRKLGTPPLRKTTWPAFCTNTCTATAS